MTEKRFIPVFIFSSAVLLLILAFTLNGTADSGDSIMHYLFARYALSHPISFFDTWAKPLYVLLASPFAQVGFTGIKVFNIINTVLAMYATYMVARRFNFNNSWLAPVLLMLAPMNFALSLSGLTEPLFACLLISGLCLLFYNHTAIGLILLSFLPFVRSEGMFLLILIAAYLFTQKKYLPVLWLCTGQVVYAIAGYSHFGSLLWFYQSNPYSFISKYGKGSILTYFIQMPLIAGPMTCLLLAVAVIWVPLVFIKRKNERLASYPLFLVWGLFVTYFSFHVIAWTFGLFGSFGMARIISAVSPLIIILSVYGYNTLEQWTKNTKPKASSLLTRPFLLVIVLNLAFMITQFSVQKGGQDFEMAPGADETVQNKLADYIKQKYPGYKNRSLYFDAAYMSLALDIDPAGRQNTVHFADLATLPSGSMYIWDSWYSVRENGITQETLLQNPLFKRDTVFSMNGGRPVRLNTSALFIKK